MDRERVFERIFGHCAYQAGRIEHGVEFLSDYLSYLLEDERLRLVDAIADSEAFTSKLVEVPECATLQRRYASRPPEGSLRHAKEEFELLRAPLQEAIVSLVFQSMVRWRTFLKIIEMIGDASPPIQQDTDYLVAEQAFELLLGFDCLMSDTEPVAKIAAVDEFVSEALTTLMDNDEPVRQPTEEEMLRRRYLAQFGPDLLPLAEASWVYENAIVQGRRYITVDLQAGMQPLERGLMNENVIAWISKLSVSSHPDRYLLLPRAIIGTAAQLFPWIPPAGEDRRISDAPTVDAVVRRCARVLAMVHELHKAGYQRLRILPFVSGSGCYWRGWITDADNVCADGFNLIDWDDEDRTGRVAKYTSGQENTYFGWTDAKGLSARGLGSMFLERFPQIAAKGRGCDWAYAGWLTDVLGFAEQGNLISLMQEGLSDPDTLRRWQPPPPIRPLS